LLCDQRQKSNKMSTSQDSSNGCSTGDATKVPPEETQQPVFTGLNRDLIRQFDKALTVTRRCQKIDARRKSDGLSRRISGSLSSGSVRRAKQRLAATKTPNNFRKKGNPILWPSRLKLERTDKQSKPEFATFGSCSGHNHFSFENCSKELESIMGEVPSSNALVSSCRASSLRPRSSSLPSQSKSEFRSSPRSKVDLSKKGCQGGVSLPHKASVASTVSTSAVAKKPVVKKRKHPATTGSIMKTSEEYCQSGGVGGQPGGVRRKVSTCAEQARGATDLAHDIDRLADFLEESISLPKKMSYMAEMMYT